MLASEENTGTKGTLPALDKILAQLTPHMDALTDYLSDQVDSFEIEVREQVHYCLRNQGKRIRPMLLFYCGWNERGEVQQELVQAAAVVELVHLATLVHDDILDDAEMRHSSETVSQKYGAATAVLLGDALFSQALHLASMFTTTEVCRAVSLATRRVCAGEISQTFERGNSDLSLEAYYRVIDLKTAELFKVSCQLGAKLAGYPDEFATAAGEFGRRLGVAYQIFDDLADFLGDESKIGKTLGTDLASGKYTLPMLLLLKDLPESEAQSLIQRMTDKTIDASEMSELMRTHGVFEAVSNAFYKEVDAADESIKPYAELPPFEHMQRLSEFVRLQVERLKH